MRIIQKVLITSTVVVPPLEVGLHDYVLIPDYTSGYTPSQCSKHTFVYQTSCLNIFRSNPHPKGDLLGVFYFYY